MIFQESTNEDDRWCSWVSLLVLVEQNYSMIIKVIFFGEKKKRMGMYWIVLLWIEIL